MSCAAISFSFQQTALLAPILAVLTVVGLAVNSFFFYLNWRSSGRMRCPVGTPANPGHSSGLVRGKTFVGYLNISGLLTCCMALPSSLTLLLVTYFSRCDDLLYTLASASFCACATITNLTLALTALERNYAITDPFKESWISRRSNICLALLWICFIVAFALPFAENGRIFREIDLDLKGRNEQLTHIHRGSSFIVPIIAPDPVLTSKVVETLRSQRSDFLRDLATCASAFVIKGPLQSGHISLIWGNYSSKRVQNWSNFQPEWDCNCSVCYLFLKKSTHMDENSNRNKNQTHLEPSKLCYISTHVEMADWSFIFDHLLRVLRDAGNFGGVFISNINLPVSSTLHRVSRESQTSVFQLHNTFPNNTKLVIAVLNQTFQWPDKVLPRNISRDMKSSSSISDCQVLARHDNMSSPTSHATVKCGNFSDTKTPSFHFTHFHFCLETLTFSFSLTAQGLFMRALSRLVRRKLAATAAILNAAVTVTQCAAKIAQDDKTAVTVRRSSSQFAASRWRNLGREGSRDAIGIPARISDDCLSIDGGGRQGIVPMLKQSVQTRRMVRTVAGALAFYVLIYGPHVLMQLTVVFSHKNQNAFALMMTRMFASCSPCVTPFLYFFQRKQVRVDFLRTLHWPSTRLRRMTSLSLKATGHKSSLKTQQQEKVRHLSVVARPVGVDGVIHE